MFPTKVVIAASSRGLVHNFASNAFLSISPVMLSLTTAYSNEYYKISRITREDIVNTPTSQPRSHSQAFGGGADVAGSQLPTRAAKKPRHDAPPVSPVSPLNTQGSLRSIGGIAARSAPPPPSFSPFAPTLVAPVASGSALQRLPGVESFDAGRPPNDVGVRIHADAARANHVHHWQISMSQIIDSALEVIVNGCGKCYVLEREYNHGDSQCTAVDTTDHNPQWGPFKSKLKLPPGYCFNCLRPQVCSYCHSS